MFNPFFKKIKMKKYILIILVLSSAVSNSQDIRPSLWLKTVNEEQTIQSKELSLTEQEKIKSEYFNFNPIIDFSDKKRPARYEHLITKQSSFFMVMQSIESQEKELLYLKNGKNKTTITNKKIDDGDAISYHKGDINTGIIVSYFFAKYSLPKQKGNLVTSPLLKQDTSSQKIMELLYFPRLLHTAEKNSVESYLSLKYGISQLGDKDYLNSSGEKIWDYKANISFSNRITGIGKDLFWEMEQKQSGNSEKDGIYFGFEKIYIKNDDNKTVLKDKTFCLWGDNGGTTTLQKKFGNLLKMDRIWKIQTTTPSIATPIPLLQLVINRNELHLEKAEAESATYDENKLWMVIDTLGHKDIDYNKAMYIAAKLTTESERIIFDNIKVHANKTQLFSFIKAPAYFVLFDYQQPDCTQSQEGDLTIKTVGGTAPYIVNIEQNSIQKQYTFNKESFTLKALLPGKYRISVVDSKGKQHIEDIAIDSFNAQAYITIAPVWYMGESQEIQIYPDTPNNDIALQYQWIKEGHLLSEEKKFHTKTPGEYILKIIQENSCEKYLPFTVKKYNQDFAQWMLYPNPVAAGEKFTLDFNYKEPATVVISVFDINGRLLQTKSLGKIQKYAYQSSLLVSGTYTIRIDANGEQASVKLIVQ